MLPDNNEMRMCKICLERDYIESLISPCHCKGSIKYVHPQCMAGWRKTLLQTGRESDIYHCQLCKQKLWVKQRTLWATLMQYRVFRIIITAILLGLILIPSGSMMKAFIHFSVLLSNYSGGITQAWANHSLPSLFYESLKTSSSTMNSNSTIHVLYSPFPVCFAPSTNDHALFSNRLVYYFLLPFSDARLWQIILCRLEHFHLGFFLLGSINNIYFTYKILNDMFDIVLLGQDQQDEDIMVLPEEFQEQRMDGIAKRFSKLLKGFLLTYCCSLVILFWIHFNIFAFHADSQHEYTSRQFLAELPLWILRWVTLGIAVGDFAARGLYRSLTKMTNCVDKEDVLSLPENK